MNLKSLIERFRVEANDIQEPPLWTDQEITGWLNEAQEQACLRGRLLMEDSNSSVCRIKLTQGTSTYKLHPALYEISSIRLVGTASMSRQLSIVSREWMDSRMANWRECQQPARWVIQDETSLRIVGTFADGSELKLEGYRLPLHPMCSDSDEPEIHRASHLQLLHWVKHQAFSKLDVEGLNAGQASKHEQAFANYFGLPVDSNLRRKTREDNPHSVMLYMP